MNLARIASVFAIASAVVVAQGPPPGSGGPRGFGGGGPGGPGFLFAGPGSHTPVTGAPYSGTQTSQFQQTLQGGNQISRTDTAKVYRDTQGRVRSEHTRTGPDGQAHTNISIFDPVGGFSYMLNPTAKTAVKVALPAAGSTPPSRPTPPTGTNAPQITTTDLGTQTINGLPATGTQVTETIPAGAIGNAAPIQVVRTTWISTDLKVPVQITSTDPRFGNTSMQLTNVVRSEPDASLFTVPADYTVTTRAGRGPGGGGGAGTARRHGPVQ